MSMTHAKQAISWKAVTPTTVRMQLQAYMLTKETAWHELWLLTCVPDTLKCLHA